MTAILLVGATTLPELFDSILTQYQLCLIFFKLEDAGCVLIRSIKDKGDIKHANALNEAFELGMSIWFVAQRSSLAKRQSRAPGTVCSIRHTETANLPAERSQHYLPKSRAPISAPF